jgi:hypothetical protein
MMETALTCIFRKQILFTRPELNRMYYTKPIEEGVQTPMYLDADSSMANANDQLPSNQAGDDKSSSTHDSSDESSDVDPEMEFGADETKSIVVTVLKEGEAITGGTLRSGKSFRDIAALHIATNPINISTAEVDYLLAMKDFGELACV